MNRDIHSLDYTAPEPYNELVVTNSDSVPSLVPQPSVKSLAFVPTPSQQRIITFPAHPNHILTIKAGPGSGKTYTVVKRIEFLINEGMLPDEILVLSMTNRAVNSLKDNLTALIGADVAQKVNVSTFHSFCASLVDTYGPLFFPNLTRKRLMDDLSWRNFSNIFLGKTIGVNGHTIKGTLTPSSLEKMLHGIKSGELSVESAASKNEVSKEYIQALLEYLDKNGIMRYQDFIIDALDLMQISLKGPFIPQLENYKVVIVDEFQDMHYLLLNVVKAVVNYPTREKELEDDKVFEEGISDPVDTCEPPITIPDYTSKNSSKHLSIAGDPNQCIYEFLGSRPDLIDNLHRQFPNSIVDELSIIESFRLTPEILTASHKVLRVGNTLQSIKPGLYKPIAYNTPSRSEEHRYIGREITRLILELGGLFKPSDFIILCRTNKEIEDINQYFGRYFGLKCNKFSLTASWINSKVHILLDLLAVLNKQAGSDFGLLCSLLIIDKRYGSRARISKLFTHFDIWRAQKYSDYQENVLEDYLRGELAITGTKSALDKVFKGPDHSKTKKELSLFLDTLEHARERLKGHQNPATILKCLQRIARKLAIIDYMNDSVDQKNLEVHLTSFYKSLEYSYQKFERLDEQGSFMEFFLRLYNDDVPLLDSDMVNVSTVHTAKGLEFPVVFVPGCSAFGQPYWQTLLADGTIRDDEKELSKARLFYVACTRAKSLLYVGTPFRLTQLMAKYFTGSKPDLSIETIRKLASLLDRKLPSATKIYEGGVLFQNLIKNEKSTSPPPYRNRTFQRNIHTSNLKRKKGAPQGIFSTYPCKLNILRSVRHGAIRLSPVLALNFAAYRLCRSWI